MYYKKGKSSLLRRQASYAPFKDPIYHQNWFLAEYRTSLCQVDPIIDIM